MALQVLLRYVLPRMDSVEKFAREAAAFERWLLSGTDREADAVSQCLIRLLDLYRAGIDLPREWSDELDDRAEIELVSDAEWRRAHEASQRLPLDYYSEVFDPTKTTWRTSTATSWRVSERTNGAIERERFGNGALVSTRIGVRT